MMRLPSVEIDGSTYRQVQCKHALRARKSCVSLISIFALERRMTRDVCTLRVVILFCTLLVALPGAQSQPQVASLPLEDFSDRLSKDVPVSGRMLVGVAIMPAKSQMPLGLPTPRVLWNDAAKGSSSDPLCVAFASRDGQYFGEGRVGAAKLKMQTIPFFVQAQPNPEAKRVLDLQPLDDFAVLASSGDCRVAATSDKATIHVVNYGTETAVSGPGNLSIAINTMTYTVAVAASVGGKGSDQAVCKPLPEAQRNKAFNTVCELALPSRQGEMDLVISRRRYERVFPPITFKVVWKLP
jgi:hypothetical protein